MHHHAHGFWPWLEHHSGVDNLAGPWYGFWSGIGSDIGELTLVIAAITVTYHIVRHLNCHAKGCKRVGRIKDPESGTLWCFDDAPAELKAKHPHRHIHWPEEFRHDGQKRITSLRS